MRFEFAPEEGGGGAAEITPEQYAALQKQLDETQKRTAEYEKILTDTDYVQYVAGKARASEGPPADRSAPKAEDLPDFEEMSQKQLVEYLDRRNQERLTASLNKAGELIGQVLLDMQVERMIDKHADFLDYQEEIIALRKEAPNMSLERLYQTAKKTAPPRKEERPPPSAEVPTNRPAPGPKATRGAPFAVDFEKGWQAAVGHRETL